MSLHQLLKNISPKSRPKILTSKEEFKLDALNDKIKKMYKKLDKITLEHDVDSALQVTIDSLEITPYKKAFSLIRQPIISLLHTKLFGKKTNTKKCKKSLEPVP